MDFAENFLGMIGASIPKSENVDQKLISSENEKNLGNNDFKNGELKHALIHYHQALLYANGLVGITKEQTIKMNIVKVSCWNNMAAAYLKEGNYTKAVNYCNKVLSLELNNVKALFRRGKAYLELNNLEKAQEDLKNAERVDPDDKSIQKELQALKKRQQEQDKKQQKFYSAMFDKLGKENEEEPKIPTADAVSKEETASASDEKK